MKDLWAKFLDYFFPRHCLSCGKINPSDGLKYLCKNCADAPFAFPIPRCKRCAEIAGSDIEPQTCPKCETYDFHFSETKVACEYASAGRELVIELKYRNGIWVAHDIAKIASNAKGFSEFFKDAIIVPVPLSKERKRKRNYNQAEVIASEIVKQFPRLNAKVELILKRVKHTNTQTALTRDARIENVKGAFKLVENSLTKDSNIIVLDDVITSCATVNECAKVLKKAGFKNIKAYAFARRS